MSRLPLLLALAAICSPLASSATNGRSSGTALHLSCEVLGLVSGELHASVGCEFDGDGRPDVLTRVGGDLMLTSGPDPRQFSALFGLDGVTSFALVGRDDHWSDAVVAAHSAGISLVRHASGPESADWTEQNQLAGNHWIGARSLLSFDLDLDGTLDVAGLSAGGDQLLGLLRQPGGTWLELAPVALGTELLSLDSIRWTGQEPMLVGPVAGLDPAGGVLVVDRLGGFVELQSLAGPVKDLAPLRVQGMADRLAVLVGEEVLVLSNNGGVEPGTPVTDFLPSAFTAADLNGDGCEDLILNSTVLDRVTVLHGSLTGTTFDPADLQVIPLHRPDADMGGQSCAPVAADFDLDGDLDVLQFVNSNRKAVLVRSTQIDEAAMHPEIQVREWTLNGGASSVSMDITVPKLPDGSLPDYLEVSLLSDVGGERLAGAASLLERELVATQGAPVGDAVRASIDFGQELGENSAILVRSMLAGQSGGAPLVLGPENAALFFWDGGFTDRGGIGGQPLQRPGSQPGTQGTPPPPVEVPTGG